MAEGIVLYLSKAYSRIDLKELIDIIKDNRVVFIWIHIILLLFLEDSRSFSWNQSVY